LAIDGDYGPQTTKAVLHWQKVNGLIEDGISGPQTLASMRGAGCGVFVAPVASNSKANPTKGGSSSTPRGKTYGPGADQWHDLAISVGWTEAQWPTVRCIIGRESNGRPEVSNSAGATGLMQILQSHRPGMNLKDPATNLRVGLEMYNARGGWGDWFHPSKPCY
jgi:peptidoglycan hydrolase-like protein with peptidoglycan-binding domain